MKLVYDHMTNYFSQKNIKSIMMINFVFFVFFMISDSIDVYIPIYLKTHTNISAVYYGAFQTVTLIVRVVVVILIAKPSPTQKKRIIFFTLLTNVILNLILVLSDNNVMFFITFGLLVVTRSVFNAVYNPALAKLCEPQRLGIVFGVRDVFLSLGSVTGLTLSGIMSSADNQNLFLLYLSIAIILVMLLTIKTKISTVASDPSENNQKTNSREKNRIVAIQTLQIQDKRNFLIFCSVGVFLSFGMSSQGFIPMIGSDMGISESSIFYMYSYSSLLTAVLSFLGGILIDKYDKNKLYYIYIVICGLSVVPLLFSEFFAFLLCLLFVSLRSVLDNIEQAYFFAYFNKVHIDKLWSFNASLQMGVSFIAPTIFGKIYDANLIAMLAISLAFIFISLIASIFLRKIGDSNGV